MPHLVRSGRVSPNKRLNAWSAGCSSGEEPYTLAMVLSEFSQTTGSGGFSIYATDISSEALDLARYNSHYHKVTEKIIFRQGNLLEPVTEPLDMIIANLPYIKTTDLSSCSTEITDFEPRIALDGGLTGLSQISELLEQISNRISHQCKLLLEIGAGQENQLSIYLRNILPHSYVRFLSDLNGIQRVASIDIFN